MKYALTGKINCGYWSPSMRREWIEIFPDRPGAATQRSLPPCGGSGLKSVLVNVIAPSVGLPPCGGSGLKFESVEISCLSVESPSMRREWIEMTNGVDGAGEKIGLPPCGGSGLKFGHSLTACLLISRLPPCGGSGLKCLTQQQQNYVFGLPPCGGSGLKFHDISTAPHVPRSPSMRREWIEIPNYQETPLPQ